MNVTTLRFLAALAGFASLAVPAAAQQTRTIEKTAICLDGKCKKGAVAFHAWELALKLPAKLGKCAVYRSTPFFAVILTRDVPDTAELDCDEMPRAKEAVSGEALRQKAAAALKGRTVFARMMCVGFALNVQYTVEGETGMLKNFLAAYAGMNRTMADTSLGEAKAHYPQAEIVSMTARVESGDAGCK